MSGRRAVPETFGEFFDRRLGELVKIPEFAKMSALDVADIIEREFYDCADDPGPAIAAPTVQ
jgi:hypothetical protein